MKLNVSQLKQFKSISSNVRNNGIIPILSYLKFSNGAITKSNLESFVIMEADFKGEMLIDENALMTFIEFTSAEQIEATVKGNSILITDGKAKVTSPTEDIKNFPAIAEDQNPPVNLGSDVIDAIRVAINFTVETKTSPYTDCIFLGDEIIAASTGFTAFIKPLQAVPEIIITSQVASSLIKFESLLFSETDTYQFFSSGTVKFGFVKDDTKFLNMKGFAVVSGNDPITIEKGDLVKFCDICASNSKGRPVSASIEKNKLTMVDSEYGINIEIPLSENLDDFTFNPVIMAKLLKAVPDNSLTFTRSTNKYFITGPSGFVCVIMEVQN